MNDMTNLPLSDREKELMKELANENLLPPELERKTIDTLKKQGLLKTRTMNTKFLTGIAAAVVALICGFFIGQNFQDLPESNNVTEKYALFLYENEEFAGGNEMALVEEYTNWAVELSQEGKLESAEKLAMNVKWLGSGSVQNVTSQLSGYFIIYASDEKEALAIARTHPHTRYGGGIELRMIERLD